MWAKATQVQKNFPACGKSNLWSCIVGLIANLAALLCTLLPKSMAILARDAGTAIFLITALTVVLTSWIREPSVL